MKNTVWVKTTAEAHEAMLELGRYGVSTFILSDDDISELINGVGLAIPINGGEYTLVLQHGENRLNLTEEGRA